MPLPFIPRHTPSFLPFIPTLHTYPFIPLPFIPYPMPLHAPSFSTLPILLFLYPSLP